jgi:hypothetical protein
MIVEAFQKALVAFMASGIASGFMQYLIVKQVNKASVGSPIRLFWTLDRNPAKVIFAYREHKRLFPDSSLRTAFLILTLMTVVFFALFIYESERTRVDSNLTQQSISKAYSLR